MTTYNFSTLLSNQHIAFNPNVDVLSFDTGDITASAVQINANGSDLGFTFGGKTVWLDATSISTVSFANVTFLNGSVLAAGDGTSGTSADWYGAEYPFAASTVGNQIWGLGGADLINTGSGADWLVGNVATAPLAHVSSVGATGSPTATVNATISADGRFVGFEGGWTGFGSINNNATDVFVKDMTTGIVSDEHRNSAGTNGTSGSGAPVVSADGSVFAFLSSSSNLVAGPSSGALYDIYVSDVAGNGIARVSTGTGGVLAVDGRSLNPDLSADGRYVVFESAASNWAANGSNATYDIFLKDRLDGSLTRVSTSLTGGDGNGDSRFAKVSADGRFVVFESAASNLTPNDTNGQTDIFVWDRSNHSLTNLSAFDPVGTRSPNNASNRPDVAFDNGWGGVVVFQTAKALLPADVDSFNGIDIYAYNLFDGTFQLVSSKADGTGVQVPSEDASISGDGRFVVFASAAGDLVPGDVNGTRDVFVKDLFTGQIALVSNSAAGVPGNQASINPEISLGGEWIVFESSASNLAGTDANGTASDVYRVANPLLLDTLIGGAGDDVYVLARADIVQEQVNGGIDTIQSSISYSLADTDGAGALGGNVENLTLTGVANLNATGNALNNVLTGNSGNNVLNGDAGSDTASYSNASGAVAVNLSVVTPQNTLGAGTDTLISIENLIGSPFNDQLTGDGGDNVLDGGPGNDTFTGGAGDDTYVADSAADVITSESTVSGGAGIDTVLAGVNWTLQAFLENLVLTGSSNLTGGGNSANNRVTGNAGNNVINGFSGDDTLDGGPGNDTMTGGAGDDTYITDSAADVITSESSVSGGSGIDTVLAGVNWTLQAFLENLVLTGTSNFAGGGNSTDNRLTGNAGSNVLSGFSGDDTLAGAAGNDNLNGGSGTDTADYTAATSGVSVEIYNGTASNDGQGGADTLISIESALGSPFNDLFFGDNNDNVFRGGAGNDQFYGGAGSDTSDYGSSVTGVSADLVGQYALDGQSGFDYLVDIENLSGSAFNDYLSGNASNNTFNGGAGSDILVGLAGNDTTDYSSAGFGVSVDLAGQYGVDGLGGTDFLVSIENVTGSAFNDYLSGTTGDNVFRGGAGSDILVGLAGSDTADYSSGAAAVSVDLAGQYGVDGLGGTDFLVSIENVIGSAFNDYLSGTTGDNIFSGGAGNDILVGLAGNDTADYGSSTGAATVDLAGQYGVDGLGSTDFLVSIENVFGSAFNDYLSGSSADNTFRGGAGNDTFAGGAGSDTVDYNSAPSAVSANLTGSFASDGQGGSDFITGIENIIGSAFGDSLIGDGAGNTLSGAAGNDFMMGAGGADGFIVGSAAGLDTITDFSHAAGDKLFLQSNLNSSGITTGAQALAHTFDSGGNAVIDLGAGNSITLLGITKAGLAASDFVIF